MDWAWIIVPSSIIAALAIGGALIRFGDWRANVNRDRREFRAFMRTMRAKLDSLEQKVDELLQRFPGPQFLASSSPLNLTTAGAEVAKKMDAFAWAEACAMTLIEQQELHDRQPYELDAIAESHVQDALDENMREHVRQCAYEYGVEEERVQALLRVVLRDAMRRLTGQVLDEGAGNVTKQPEYADDYEFTFNNVRVRQRARGLHLSLSEGEGEVSIWCQTIGQALDGTPLFAFAEKVPDPTMRDDWRGPIAEVGRSLMARGQNIARQIIDAGGIQDTPWYGGTIHYVVTITLEEAGQSASSIGTYGIST